MPNATVCDRMRSYSLFTTRSEIQVSTSSRTQALSLLYIVQRYTVVSGYIYIGHIIGSRGVQTRNDAGCLEFLDLAKEHRVKG